MLEARNLGDLVSPSAWSAAPKIFSYPQAAGRLPHLLQWHQNAPVIAQRCAGFSSHSTDRQHHVTSHPRWASSPLRSDL